MANEAKKKAAIKPVTPKKSNFSKEVAEVEKERNAAPKLAPVQDEYRMIAGYKDEKGTLHTTYTIRPVNGFDEEYLGKQKNATYAKVMTMLVERCTLSIGTIKKSDVKPSVWHDIIESLYVGDCDNIMLHIREISFGEDLELKHVCPKCKTQITSHMSTDELNVIEWDGKEGVPFELQFGYFDEETGEQYRTGIIKYPTVRDREVAAPLGANNAARGETVYLNRLVVFDGELKTTERVIQSLSAGDRRTLSRLLEENQFGLDMNVPIECPNCGHAFDGALNTVTNFF